MLRVRLPRRAYLGAATALAITPREKLSIYPENEGQLVLVDTPSELERRIGSVRESVAHTYADSYAYVQGWVSKWIAIEHAVERRIKSFKAPDEVLTPGALYIGVATLSGSILARTRGLPTRFLLPPTLFLLSFNHFLPHTATNVGAYISDLEHTYVPRAAQFTDTAAAHTQMTWEMAKDKAREGRAVLERGVVQAVGAVQESTGLKLREALGLGRTFGEDVVKAAEVRGREAVEKVEEGAKEVKTVVEEKAEEAKKLV
ncbi:apolipo protein O-domain-containing protein [Phellopilus nigrolimitatus]|nr:apolipo protein O-domain-containing protein [Phellopilus nigrolimitatus]